MDKSLELLFEKMAEDEEFAKVILSQETSQSVIKIAGKEGIELTEENLNEVGSILKKYRNEDQIEMEEEELSDENLENVAGGSLFKSVKSFVKNVRTVIGIMESIEINVNITNTPPDTSTSPNQNYGRRTIPSYPSSGGSDNPFSKDWGNIKYY